MLLAIAEKLFDERDPSRWAEYSHHNGGPGHMDLLFECVSEANGPNAVEAKNSISIAYRKVKVAYSEFSPRGEEFDVNGEPLIGLQGTRALLYSYCLTTSFAMKVMGMTPA